jgi:hypothetical protein
VWALTNLGTRVRRIIFDAAGNITSQWAGFAVPTSEDITVSADGSHIYVVQGSSGVDTHAVIQRYTAAGAFVNSIAVDNGNDLSASGTTARIAVNPSNGRVYFAETVFLNPEAVNGILMLSYSANLSGVNLVGRLNPSDGHRVVRDIDASDGLVALHRSAGSGNGKISIYNFAIEDELVPEDSSMALSGTLSWGGTTAGFCGSGKAGGYLWQARSNTNYDMLARHQICED